MSAEQISTAQLLEEREWRRCAPDTRDPQKLLEAFEYFCWNYCHIKHPDRGRIKFELFDSQVDSVNLWIRSRYSLMLKARQLGFSTLVAVYAFWLAFFYEDRVVIMLSRTEREAIKLLQKSKYVYRFLPEWMKFRGPPMNATQTKMEFSNESYIESMPSASDPARGESVYLAIIDELAYLPNSEEAWASIEPIADVGGRIIALSTANGEGNLFHQLWVGAETKNNRFKAMFHPWWANGRTQEWYDEKSLDLPDWQMAQEYPDNPEDAFLRSGRPVFSLDVVRAITPRDPIICGYFRPSNGEFVPDDGGPLKVWALPAPDGKYAIGADPAMGLEHGDFTSVHVINARNGEVVAHWHGRIDTDLLATDVLIPLGNWYHRALIGVENNNHGLTTVVTLSKKRYHPIFMQRSPRYKRSKPTDILGWRTSSISKPVAIDELGANLRDGTIKLFCADTIAELRTFVRNDAGKMTGSPYDDRTMSLAIANQMIKFVFLKQYQPELEPGPGTMGWMEKILYGDDLFSNMTTRKRPPEPEPIGKQFVRKDEPKRR